MKFKPGSIFETKCKKDYSFFYKDEYYTCLIVDKNAFCVIYSDGFYDNLAFGDNVDGIPNFTDYFYTENEMKLLKLKKLSTLK